MLEPGTLLHNRYRIERVLGLGGMATVYLAADTRLGGRKTAIKEMDPANLPVEDREWAVAAFRQEAEMLARLNHPRLALVSDFFQEDGYWYLVMEYVEGETLATALARAGRFEETRVLDWAEQLADVLAYLHGQNPPIVFRDLKPENVMHRPDGSLKLIDFGVARFFKPGQTADTLQLGTVGYAAPEQYGRGQTGPRSDVYALGVLLHQLLTGYDPATTPMNLPPVAGLAPRVSSRTAAAVDQALAIDPDERFQTVQAFLRGLRGPRQREAKTPAGRSPRFYVALGAVGTILALLALAFYLRQSSHDATAAATLTPTLPAVAVATTSAPAVEAVSPTPVPATVTPVLTSTPGSPTATPEPTGLPTSALALSPPPDNAAALENSYLTNLSLYRTSEPTIFAYRVQAPVQVDGVLGEWQGRRYPVDAPVDNQSGYGGRDDLSGELQIAWDREYLYLAVQVRDDRFVQARSGRNLYLGDSLEIQLDADLAGDFADDSPGADDFQIGFSPGDFGTRPGEIFLWMPRPQEAPLPGNVSARPSEGGYKMEVALPWSALGLSPGDGAAYGFTFCISDNDQPGQSVQESMVCTHSSRLWANPSSLGTLVLVER